MLILAVTSPGASLSPLTTADTCFFVLRPSHGLSDRTVGLCGETASRRERRTARGRLVCLVTRGALCSCAASWSVQGCGVRRGQCAAQHDMQLALHRGVEEGALQGGPAEVGPADQDPAQVRVAEVGPTERRLAEIGPAQIGPPQVRPP